jgi:hypothetical protein
MFNKKAFAALGVAAISLYSTKALPASDQEINAIRSEIKQMKEFYESKIDDLEAKLSALEGKQQKTEAKVAKVKSDLPDIVADSNRVKADSGRNILDNSFNPSIGVILNGTYRANSEDSNEIAGFGVGEEGERGGDGLSLGESELNFSANVDDKFYGSVTAAIVREDGSDIIELEEAYVQTLPGFGLPQGLTLKGGRAFWSLGYLNEHHAHTDDFADRPLPYRVFFNKAFNDDGAEISYVLPTDIYAEIGGGLFKGEDFPSGGSGDSDSYSAFIRTGGDIGDNASFRIGGSFLNASNVNGRLSNEDEISFSGQSHIYGADLRATYAPTGNAKEQEIILQAEYFRREEDGIYTVDLSTTPTSSAFDDSSSGWYAQAVYKFLPEWRAGYRFTQLDAPDTPAALVGSELDANGHDPHIHSVMLDWTNSEFSRVRLQYNDDHVVDGETDHQVLLQYIMSLGAHGAHKY